MRSRDTIIFEGISFVATYSESPTTGPNIGWLDLRIMHCGPRGEAIAHRHTKHNVFMAEPHDNIRPGFGSPSWAQVICRAKDIA